MSRAIVGVILHAIIMVILMYATSLSTLMSFVIAGLIVWLGILVVTENMFD